MEAVSDSKIEKFDVPEIEVTDLSNIIPETIASLNEIFPFTVFAMESIWL